MLGKLLRSLSGRNQAAKVTPTQAAEDVSDANNPVGLPGLPFLIRPLEEQDLPALARVFEAAIENLASRDYDPAQRKAWAADAGSDAFNQALREGVTMVADNDGTPVAFAQLHPQDHLRMLYVDPDWAGLGISILLYQYLEDEARILGSTTLSTHSSVTAQRFFKGMGFKDEQEETVKRQGQSLRRYRMSKTLVR